MKEVTKLMRPVYYYNECLWYQVHSCTKHKLLNKNNELKQFIVIDVTKDVIYTKDEFLEKFYSNSIINPKQIVNDLDSLKFKVYKKIKL
jgi:thiamine pyrophosphokinase